ncbi:MAG TPA: hypothetical protein VFT37_07975 [Telluria sp.]|nr:hypothetical protein [Telluria sp.]
MHTLKLMSLIAIVIGFALMAFKIYADSEPGAIPLALIVLGLGSYFFARSRIRSSKK